jgi:uncharacterized protein DUF4372/DDE family transposase
VSVVDLRIIGVLRHSERPLSAEIAMNVGRTVFAQLMEFIPQHQFRRCVDRYHGNRRARSLTCWDQFLCMAFAQFTYRESLRDIEACLRAVPQKLYHSGLRGVVSRSTLAAANEKRDCRIYADLAHFLMSEARTLYARDPFLLNLDRSVYALDSTTIELCITLFPWAAFHKWTASVKLHTLLDLRGSIPRFARITLGRVHDGKIMDLVAFEPGAIYVFDRGYLDFSRLYGIEERQATFVTRTKRDIRFQRLSSRPVDKGIGLRCDQTVRCKGQRGKRDYPRALRRVRFYDMEQRRTLVFLTNNFVLPALTIAELYRSRWRIELFFRWIKQHLRIHRFYGVSANAVKTQIWIALCVYLLVAIARKRLGIDRDLYTILQVLSISLFEKITLAEAFSGEVLQIDEIHNGNQLPLFNL